MAVGDIENASRAPPPAARARLPCTSKKKAGRDIVAMRLIHKAISIGIEHRGAVEEFP